VPRGRRTHRGSRRSRTSAGRCSEQRSDSAAATVRLLNASSPNKRRTRQARRPRAARLIVSRQKACPTSPPTHNAGSEAVARIASSVKTPQHLDGVRRGCPRCCGAARR
jgi:hypothetical protein